MIPQNANSSARLMSVLDAMSYLGIGRTQFYKLIKLGHINPVKIGRRTFVINSELDSWIDNLPRIGGQA